MATAIIVGGGIGGIASALLLRRSYQRVLLVERAPRLGGLLQTAREQDGLAYDFGTHFAATTGIADLDDLLFDFVSGDEWHEFDYLKAGNYFAGGLNENGAFIDASCLQRDVYLEGLEKLLDAMPGEEEPTDLHQQLVETYGSVYAEHIFEPVLRKLFGVDSRHLAPEAHVLFGMKRVMVASAEASRELKRSPLYDQRIAFHNAYEGVNPARVFYPRAGGIGRWVEGLTAKLRKAGVEILTGRSVEHVDHSNGRVRSLALDDGQSFECDRLIWTVPPFLLAKAAEIEVPSCPPRLRHTSLFHFVFDRPFSTDLHYFYVYDPRHSVFRVTLYPNIGGQENAAGKYHCTAEVLSDGTRPLAELTEQAREDLYAMGIVPADAHCHAVGQDLPPSGFPVLTGDFVKASRAQSREIASRFDNLHLLGKASGASFFMNDVLREAYLTLSEACDDLDETPSALSGAA